MQIVVKTIAVDSVIACGFIDNIQCNQGRDMDVQFIYVRTQAVTMAILCCITPWYFTIMLDLARSVMLIFLRRINC